MVTGNFAEYPAGVQTRRLRTSLERTRHPSQQLLLSSKLRVSKLYAGNDCLPFLLRNRYERFFGYFQSNGNFRIFRLLNRDIRK